MKTQAGTRSILQTPETGQEDGGKRRRSQGEEIFHANSKIAGVKEKRIRTCKNMM